MVANVQLFSDFEKQTNHNKKDFLHHKRRSANKSQVTHLTKLLEHANVLLIEFALANEFTIVLPPVEQTAVLHTVFIGQMMTLLDECFELLIVVEPVLLTPRCSHDSNAKV